jgi:hypothetical protein
VFAVDGANNTLFDLVTGLNRSATTVVDLVPPVVTLNGVPGSAYVANATNVRPFFFVTTGTQLNLLLHGCTLGSVKSLPGRFGGETWDVRDAAAPAWGIWAVHVILPLLLYTLFMLSTGVGVRHGQFAGHACRDYC